VYALGILMVLSSFIASLALLLSLPSPITIVTGYLNVTGAAYLGVGVNLLVIYGVNYFNLPIRALNLVIPAIGTNITAMAQLASGSPMILMIYEDNAGHILVIAPGLNASGNPGSIIGLSGEPHYVNITVYVGSEVRKYMVNVPSRSTGIIYAFPYVNGTMFTAYVFPMVSPGNATLTKLWFTRMSSQGLLSSICNLTSPVTAWPGNAWILRMNITQSGGSINGVAYWCNSSLASILLYPGYVNMGISVNYSLGSFNIHRILQYPIYVFTISGVR